LTDRIMLGISISGVTPFLLNQIAACGVGLLLLLAALAILVCRRPFGCRLIYGSCALV